MSYCKNCMGSCRHHKIEDVYEIVENEWARMKEFKGYRHFCDKNPEGYADWHNRNKNNTYEQYKNDDMPCYEPTDLSAQLEKCIDLAQELIDKLEEDKKE